MLIVTVSIFCENLLILIYYRYPWLDQADAENGLI